MKPRRLSTLRLFGVAGCCLLLIVLLVLTIERNPPPESSAPPPAVIVVWVTLLVAVVTCAMLLWRFALWLGARRAILLGAVLAFVACGVFPPWLSHGNAVGYSFILLPPLSSRLDFVRLTVEWLCVGAVASLAWLFTAKAKKPKGSDE